MFSVNNTLSRHYKTLEFAYIWKYFEIWKEKQKAMQGNLQDIKDNNNLYRNYYLMFTARINPQKL